MIFANRREFLKILGITACVVTSDAKIFNVLEAQELIRQGYVQLPYSVAEQIKLVCSKNYQVMVVPFSNKLLIYPIPIWEQVESGLMKRLSTHPSDGKMIRYLIGGASGSILEDRLVKIPEFMLTEFSLSRSVSVAWSNNHAEVWKS